MVREGSGHPGLVKEEKDKHVELGTEETKPVEY